MATEATGKSHLGYLDGLRGLAAVFVVIHHAFQQGVKVPEPSRVTRTAMWLFEHGHLAVNLFIVLSGFCLMIPVTKLGYSLQGGAWRFFAKRARRILPPYYLAMGLSLVLIATLVGDKTGTHWDASIPVTPYDVAMHAALVQDVDRDTSAKINHAFWSISVEWRIYFLFPLLVWCWRRAGAGWTVALAAAASAAAWVTLSRLETSTPALNLEPWGMCPHYLLLFALGMLAADVALAPAHASSRIGRVPWGAALVVATLAYFALAVGGQRLNRSQLGVVVPWAVRDVAFGLWVSCLLAWVASPRAGLAGGTLRRLLSWRPLAFVGTFAYSNNLIHGPLVQVVWQ
jgi:peptidoglycan/LPS O-acetylase OafA/YrhL